jgi:short-subunit dehydrogenase
MEGKTVLLTGASGAIGSEVARKLAARGARLVLSARRVERLEQLAGELAKAGAPRPLVAPADLSRRGAATELAAQVGDVDVLINNAGGSVQGLSWVVGDRDEARAVLETNLWSPLALIAALVPEMVRRGEGAIVNVGSLARVSPFPHLGVYAASRSALATVTEVLDMELRPRGVRVVELALGPVDTPASRENRVLAGADRWLDGRPGIGEADAAADAIVAAALGGARGVAFYPRVMRWVHRMPGLGRRYARRAARHADLEDEAVRLAG